MGRTRLGLAIAVLACACGPTVADDASGGGDDAGDPALERECRAGCMDTQACAPTEFAALFADVDQCAESCVSRYGACFDEATEYFACVADATCDVVARILTVGPMTTACGPAYEAAETACGR